MNAFRKSVLFLVTAAIGCFAFALLGELFLLATQTPIPPVPPVQSQSVCITIDVSGSMQGGKLAEVKLAAKRCLDVLDFNTDEAALVSFSSNATINVPFTNDKQQLARAIGSLSEGGGTSFYYAMQSSQQAFGSAKNAKSLILFTDGQSTDMIPYSANPIAIAVRSGGANIYAIGTSDANRSFLAGLTGDDTKVFEASSGNFTAIFQQVMETIKGNLIGSGSNSDTFWWLVFRIGTWTAFLCFGIALALIMTQHKLLHKKLVSTKQVIVLAVLTFITGLIAGGFGQILFSGFYSIGIPYSDAVGRIVGWMLLGVALAYGMGLFIPNLNKDWAVKLGAIGGLLGVIGFLYLSQKMGFVGGRLLGAAILGACIGLLVAVAEAMCKSAWLTISYSENEKTEVNLGAEPVSLGSGRSDTVFISGMGESAVTFRLVNGQIYCKQNGSETAVANGYEINFGSVKVVVNAV
ncbi:MAG: VWA domain-containing protein [Planctomycetaceae bacterium]|jgi:Ca-activated chloride channel family protein|nr:VWA domain-containing protein [Planctomycetaceae bacterium]